MSNKKVNKVETIVNDKPILVIEDNGNIRELKPYGNYQVITFEGKGLIGINEVLSKFKGEIVQVISFRDEIGKYTLKALCKL